MNDTEKRLPSVAKQRLAGMSEAFEQFEDELERSASGQVYLCKGQLALIDLMGLTRGIAAYTKP